MSRDVTGTYTLPVGNPVSTGTAISSTWANATFSDVASALTNSLDRTGNGAMLSPIKLPDGGVSAPGMTYSNETSSGWYRQSAGVMSASILGVKIAEIAAAGMTIPAGKKLTVAETASAATDAVNLSKLQADITASEATMTAAIAAAVSAALPTGIISLWSGAANAIPSGWLLCNGSSGTPDLRNRFIVGAGDTYAVGDTGGSATVTLTSGEIPAHAHSINVNSGTESDFHQHTININTGGQSQSHTHDYTVVDADGVGSNTSGFVTGTSGTNTTGNASQDHIHNVSGTSANQNTAHFHNVSGNTANAGGGGAHENRPPYYALCYIMKA